MPQVIVRPHRPPRRAVGEVAGGAAADCTAVACCCPCTVLNILVLAVYKLPKGLVLKAARKRRRRLTKNNNKNINDVVLLQPHRCSTDITFGSARLEEFLKSDKAHDQDEYVQGLEKEMWARFAATGFWRSESQRLP
ncbi:uncharacterized protein LOC109814259 [Cajanus cajan]|uniref:Uncharacterized protein n=1 Tax=Cajanus cajan TaxID=3821 RepID=A0A151S0G2_CAJCA|nr:uncharacterized protein LOC109814259 [Cajanus cajan]KYP48288.1 hypothetical protein KK1_030074 [Cajanus cajan]